LNAKALALSAGSVATLGVVAIVAGGVKLAVDSYMERMRRKELEVNDRLCSQARLLLAIRKRRVEELEPAYVEALGKVVYGLR
jgi:hypothetical protein